MAQLPQVMHHTSNGEICVDEMSIKHVCNTSKLILRKKERPELQLQVDTVSATTARLILKWLLLLIYEERINTRSYQARLWDSLPEKFKNDGSHPHPDQIEENALGCSDNYIIIDDRVTVEDELNKLCDFVHYYQ